MLENDREESRQIFYVFGRPFSHDVYFPIEWRYLLLEHLSFYSEEKSCDSPLVFLFEKSFKWSFVHSSP